MKPLAAHSVPWVPAQRWPARLLLIGLAIGLLVLPSTKLIRLGLAARQAYSAAQGFQYIVQRGLDANSWPLAQSLLAEASHALNDANQELAFFQPLLQRLTWLPGYGQTLAALPTLGESGAELGQLAVTGFAVAEPLLAAPTGTLPISRLPHFLQTATPQLEALQTQATALEQRLATLDPTALGWGLAEPVSNLQAAVALLTAGLRISAAVPDLLGIAEMRTYLLLVQNNHELRATGGFITSIGRLTVADGQIIALEFADSYADDLADLPHPAAPPPMQRYMHIDRLFLRDVNWSPDLPTTARLAQALYQQSSGHTVDGVITLDLQAVELLVGALAPLQAPAIEGAITADNFVTRAQELWAAPAQSDASLAHNSDDWWRQRKDFIPLVAQAAFARLQQGNFDYLALTHAVHQALATRALQLWFTNATLHNELAQLHWDGGLHPAPTADYLALVESNFGYNKVNAVVERTLAYTVEWPADATQPAVATVTLTYRHPHPPADAACDPRPRYGLTYADMIARCYFSFVRLYVPAGSQLLTSSGVLPDSVGSQTEGDNQVFSGYFVLPPSAQTQIRFQYQLPMHLQAANYRLVLQKQAGTGALPFTTQVGNHRLATTIRQGWFEWQAASNRDGS